MKRIWKLLIIEIINYFLLIINLWKENMQRVERNIGKIGMQKGGNSGAGSYNNLALFKASVLNNFIKKNNINMVIEWGSNDCNQISFANYKSFIG